MVGSIQAGWPSPEEEALRDIISMDEYLITRPESSFLLTVSGDSMIGEGIMEGDLVIVEKGREPKDGDVVVAEVDGEWTMKYFRKQGKQIFLEAANPKYPVIRAKAEQHDLNSIGHLYSLSRHGFLPEVNIYISELRE